MSEYYYELTIKPKSHYEQFLDLLEVLTNNAIEELDGTLIARSEDDLTNVEFGINEFAKRLDTSCETSCVKKENQDWIKNYQQSVKSAEIGKFYIRPSWEEKKDGSIDIIIDPALSFGSGHHETTASCILAIEQFVKEKSTVLDVGCGSGILSIAAAKLGCAVDICDTDDVCIKDTKDNFKLNSVNFNDSWIGSANNAKKKYDVVIANIVADVLVMIHKDLKKCLNDDGILIVSGILDKHLDRVLRKFEDLNKLEVIHKNEWVTIVFSK
ncbi:50S ribosomal protein L11 methyltransferase [Malaciobacter molluscorum LMG 25693]|uniref:Ribosomal protein L11 methyltransferase n=1 Tax=Malaciobacter molluscorum LMG 25693 TaxID=870501 RepID=A0A2G1DGH0_9BACT|nr:50S ribosomal protein L11 methyltransferase [Malaciobacter molluscorum]AXX91514.1 50S ribosomal protein L11 methyltransferase [Malaciobacter molluscorum LMG 25693]PHO17599.1 50S ribosomal protein L11 methyltransferase [Malaciobacter molluscorum LMG 25693]